MPAASPALKKRKAAPKHPAKKHRAKKRRAKRAAWQCNTRF